uniref:U1764b n=1 Tax=Mycobacterium leprae TaxID=1769 RepID=Q49983_MYCLR|nr:u1764b [Mycobacterium leprae]
MPPHSPHAETEAGHAGVDLVLGTVGKLSTAPNRGTTDTFDDNSRPVLITTAAPSYEEERRTRVRKYMTLMAFRIPALMLTTVAYSAWHNGLISLLIVAASVPLPWMAVLIANDRPLRRTEEPRRFDSRRRRTPLLLTTEQPAFKSLRRPPPKPTSLATDSRS